MRIERGQDGEPLLTIGASDKFGPAVARHLAMLLETSGGAVGDVAKLRQVAARMEAWLPPAPVAAEPDPEPTPTAEPVPDEPEPEDEPETVELPEAARAGRKGRR